MDTDDGSKQGSQRLTSGCIDRKLWHVVKKSYNDDTGNSHIINQWGTWHCSCPYFLSSLWVHVKMLPGVTKRRGKCFWEKPACFFPSIQIQMDQNARKVRNQDINPCIEVSSPSVTCCAVSAVCLLLAHECCGFLILCFEILLFSGEWWLPEVSECLQLW